MTRNSLLDITWSITSLELLHLKKNVSSYLHHFHLALLSIFPSSRCVYFCCDTHKNHCIRWALERLMCLVFAASFLGSHLRAVMKARYSFSLPVASLSRDLVMHQKQPERKRHAVSQNNSLLSVSIGPHSGGEWHTRGRLEIGYKITAIHSYVNFTRL